VHLSPFRSVLEANARVQYVNILYQQPAFDIQSVLAHLTSALALYHQISQTTSSSPSPSVTKQPAAKAQTNQFKTPKASRKLTATPIDEAPADTPVVDTSSEVLASCLVPMQSAIDMLGVLGQDQLRTHYLLVLRQLAALSKNVDLQVWSMAELVAEYLAADRTRQAGLVLVRAENIVEQQSGVGLQSQVLLWLRYAQYYAALSLEEKR
jgi:hypothetical protein